MKHKKILESLVSQSLSLTLSNIDKLYLKYVHKNLEKIKSDLNRVGYFIIKNKVSLGKDKNTERNIFMNKDKQVNSGRIGSDRKDGSAATATVPSPTYAAQCKGRGAEDCQ